MRERLRIREYAQKRKDFALAQQEGRLDEYGNVIRRENMGSEWLSAHSTEPTDAPIQTQTTPQQPRRNISEVQQPHSADLPADFNDYRAAYMKRRKEQAGTQ